jgi:uncharacterized protein (DUF952 family)
MGAPFIYHMCPRDAWVGKEDEYYPPTYAADGFIHCSPAVSDALLEIGNHFYASTPPSMEWIVLTIDVSKLRGEVKWEKPMAVGDVETQLEEDVRMPHVYGTIDREAATVTHRMDRDPGSGAFLRIEQIGSS